VARTITIADRIIGGDAPCFVIAEVGANHNRQLDLARRLVDAAVDAGADAVKFQSFRVQHWVSQDFTEFPTLAGVPDLHAALRQAELPYGLYSELAAYCAARGVICFSTPSHVTDVDELHRRGAPAFKFGSVQITDLPTLVHAARYGRPLILSGGAANLSEVARAVETILATGNDQLALLHCTSVYPCTDFGLLNLRVLPALQATFDFPIGYSDHTTDPVLAPVAAVALGAKLVEKHITLDRRMSGPDHSFALEPAEFARMVDAIRKTERALGQSRRRMLPEEAELARLGRRSLVATRDIPVGATIRRADLTTKRPGFGIPPEQLDLIAGRTARQRIPADHVLTWDMVLGEAHHA
jgi:N,N'-diacetyllegionaminate synthase